jgi:hypothetical protein
MDNAFINTEMTGRQIVDQPLAKVIERFFIKPHKRFFARLKANQIVVRHEQVLTNIQPAVDQFVVSMNTLF